MKEARTQDYLNHIRQAATDMNGMRNGRALALARRALGTDTKVA